MDANVIDNFYEKNCDLVSTSVIDVNLLLLEHNGIKQVNNLN